MNRLAPCLLAALLLCPTLAWSQTPVEIRDPTTNQSISPATATGQTAANNSLSTIAGAQGTSGTGITQPTGGTGVLGWLSGIFNKLNTSIAVTNSPLTLATISSTSLEGSHVFKASAGTLYGFTGLNTTMAGYYMLFDATSAPADGAVTPKYVLPAPANQAVGISAAPVAMTFSTGIVAVFSTTGPFTKTASSTAFLTALVQ